MSIVINDLHQMEGYHDRHFGTVTHNGHSCRAVIVGEYSRLLTLLHTKASAEYELNHIISVDINLPPDDELSGIFPTLNDCVVVDGTVNVETVIDDYFSYFQIYIQNGADSLSLSSDDLLPKAPHQLVKPQVGTRIRIVGKGLHVYPTFT